MARKRLKSKTQRTRASGTRAPDPGRSGKTKRRPLCPECGSATVVPIIHGVPDPKEEKALRRGEAVLANREEWEGMTEWYCKSCGCDWSGEWRRFKQSRR